MNSEAARGANRLYTKERLVLNSVLGMRPLALTSDGGGPNQRSSSSALLASYQWLEASRPFVFHWRGTKGRKIARGKPKFPQSSALPILGVGDSNPSGGPRQVASDLHLAPEASPSVQVRMLSI